ncbi:MAG: YtxH domain-containing protein [Prevotella sp.]|jgi:gas vesicle protein|nr:YtxH domain-containing protein [Prevotella sp.]
MKGLGYLGVFIGGAIAGAAAGLLLAPESGKDTRAKITDTVEDFLKKHNIKLNRKEVGEFVDDLEDVAD